MKKFNNTANYWETRKGGKEKIVNRKIKDRIKQNCSIEVLKSKEVEDGRGIVLDAYQ